jgi:hypothetical protein
MTPDLTRLPGNITALKEAYGMSHIKRSRCVTHQVELGTLALRIVPASALLLSWR